MLKRNPTTGLLACVPGRALRCLQTSVPLLSLVLALSFVRTAPAQAIPAAQRSGQIDVFGAFALTKPDYGETWDKGGMGGADLLFRQFRFGQPGIEFRYSKVTGATSNETFVGGGVESHYRIGKLAPYAALLYGVGGITVPQFNYSDSGNTLQIGGGADYPLTHRFSARGEFMYGFMHISGSSSNPDSGLHLTPATINIGLVYNIK